MTEPDPTLPEVSPEDQSAAVIGALKNRARELGLTWDVKLATVVDGGNAAAVLATYDNDTVPIAMVSMVGALGVDQRVYVLDIPPSGNFITGTVGGQPGGGFALRVRRSLINLANSVATPIVWDAIDQEDGGNWLAVGGSVITIPADGWYTITVEMEMASPGVPNSLQYVGFMVTSAIPNWTGTSYRDSWSNAQTTGTVTASIPLLAGDTVEATMQQGSYAGVFVAARLTALRTAGFAP